MSFKGLRQIGGVSFCWHIEECPKSEARKIAIKLGFNFIKSRMIKTDK